jgi:signal transduction histidine kinase
MALAALAATLLTTVAGAQTHRMDRLAVALAVLSCCALVGRRSHPVLAFVISGAAAEGYLSSYHGNQGAMVLVAPLIALYTVADLSHRGRALAVGGVAIVVFAGSHLLMRPSARLGADNLALAALGALAVAAGNASHNRRDYLAEVEARARRAEQDREFEAARRVTDERLRIARDLHDVVGHHLALISVQAQVASHVLDTDPGQAREALGHIRGTSKAALRQLRDTIGLLRQPGEPTAPVEPTVGLSGMADLFDSFRRSGLVIDECVEGTTCAVPVAVDLTAYRVLQESLTNVCKHVGQTAVTVRLRYRPTELQVIVDNRPVAVGGGVARPVADGHGIVGMRERVTALGGTLSAGPRPDGGYRVTAALPLGTAAGPPNAEALPPGWAVERSGP